MEGNLTQFVINIPPKVKEVSGLVEALGLIITIKLTTEFAVSPKSSY